MNAKDHEGETPADSARKSSQEPVHLFASHIQTMAEFGFPTRIVGLVDSFRYVLNSLTLSHKSFTDDMAANLSWSSMTTLTSIDFQKCSLTSIPSGISELDPAVLKTLKLEGNPLVGFHRTLVEYESTPEDIIVNLREALRGGNVVLNTVKVMVVGEPAVGKTTMLRVLYGHSSQELAARPCFATDGIDMGEATVEGLRLMFWDFAGQEVYRYTHQLFLSDNAICLVMFRLTTAEEEANGQLIHWMDSVLQRAPNASCVLIGTCARTVSEREANVRVRGHLSRLQGLYGERVCEAVAIDSLHSFGISLLKDALVRVARQKVIEVPKIMHHVGVTLSQSLDPLRVPLFSWADIKALFQYSVPNEDLLKTVIRSLHSIGSVVEVKYLEYDANSMVERVFVISNPKWLADLLRTIVSVCAGAVKNGLTSHEQLARLWSTHTCATEPLIHLMCQLDIMVRLEGEGERYLLPCMLPDTSPDGVPLTCTRPQWVFRRSYLMCEGKTVPIGVMGKVIANSMRWGRVVCVWKEGCVVTKEDVWYSVRRMRVDCKTDGVHILMSSTKSGASSYRSCFVHFRMSVSNVLSEFYHIPHLEVIPLDNVCTDWCTLDDVTLSLLRKMSDVTTHRRGSTPVAALCGDVRVNEVITKIPSKNIRLFEVLGDGAYGVVQRGEMFPNPEVDVSEGRKEESGVEESVEVAVKILKDTCGGTKGEIETFLSTHREIYLMSSVRHPNIVRLHGVCEDTKSLWVVMELMRGGDLFSALTDPFGLVRSVDRFSREFDTKYYEVTCGRSDLTMREALEKEMSDLKKCVDLAVLPHHNSSSVSLAPSSSSSSKPVFELSDLHEKLVECGERHWNEKTWQSHNEYASARDEILNLSSKIVTPLPRVTLLRIALDVSMGVCALHSLNPPLVHRDLKTQNVFLSSITPLHLIRTHDALSHTIAKIGDFGLSQFTPFQLRAQKDKGMMGYIMPRWTAPEILRGEPYSIHADVYSLGLLLWEVKYRTIAFGEVGDGAFQMEEVRKFVLSGGRPPVCAGDSYDELCCECWRESPLHRPHARKVVKKLCEIIQRDTPFLWENVSDLVSPSLAKPLSSSSPPLSRSLNFSNTVSVEGCHITCSALSHSLLWFGCRNGKVGVLDTENEAIFFAEDGPSAPSCVVNCVVNVKKSDSVWMGDNCGMLTAWNASLSSGKMAAETLFWQGDARRHSVLYKEDGAMSLCAGMLTWQRKGGVFGKHLVEIAVSDILSVQMVKDATFTIETDSGTTTFTSDSARVIVSHINKFQRYVSQPSILTKRAERRLTSPLSDEAIVPISSLAEIDGNAWTLDGRMCLTEWIIEVNHTGVLRGVLYILPQRSLQMDSVAWKREGCASVPVGVWSVGLGEYWVGVGMHFVRVLNRGSLPFSDTPLSQEEVLQNRWRDVPEDVSANDLTILCAVVVQGNGIGAEGVEVWASTHTGMYIWGVSGVVTRKIDLEDVVSAMVVVHDEVWCGTMSGKIVRIHTKSGILSEVEKRHTHIVSGICVSVEGNGGQMYTTSMDGTINIYSSELGECPIE